jgi:hypothetical protein
VQMNDARCAQPVHCAPAQYNCISLGLAVAATAAIFVHKNCMGSILYSLALNHKQMSLYFAPAFFAHLLGRCCHAKGLWKVCSLISSMSSNAFKEFHALQVPAGGGSRQTGCRCSGHLCFCVAALALIKRCCYAGAVTTGMPTAEECPRLLIWPLAMTI